MSPGCALAVDASPWGIGGMLILDYKIISYFATPITEHDIAKFSASVGDSRWNTRWEALALLISFRLWLPQFSDLHMSIRCKSDSRAALGAILKLSSPSRELATIEREISLDLAQGVYELAVLEYIPGVTNVIPDALSRLRAPQPKQLPTCVAGVPTANAPPRDDTFWRVR